MKTTHRATALPNPVSIPNGAQLSPAPPPPPLEYEPPHRRLARLNKEADRLVSSLQELKAKKAARQLKAAACHQALSTPENTWFENQKRDLAAELLKTQMEIGSLNKELRAKAADKNASKRNSAAGPAPSADTPPPLSRFSTKKTAALRAHAEFPAYFLLAAKEELIPGLYDQVEARAKQMLSDAQRMGLETR